MVFSQPKSILNKKTNHLNAGVAVCLIMKTVDLFRISGFPYGLASLRRFQVIDLKTVDCKMKTCFKFQSRKLSGSSFRFCERDAIPDPESPDSYRGRERGNGGPGTVNQGFHPFPLVRDLNPCTIQVSGCAWLPSHDTRHPSAVIRLP